MWLYALVIGTGFLVITLQQFMPAIMRKSLPREFVFEQIPYLRAQLLKSAVLFRGPIAEALANGLDQDPSPKILCGFLDEECLPYLRAKPGTRSVLGDPVSAADIFRDLKVNVEPHWWSRIEKMELWCEERRIMDTQTKYHHWLHGWLVVHIPASFALLFLTAWHAWVGIQFLLTASL